MDMKSILTVFLVSLGITSTLSDDQPSKKALVSEVDGLVDEMKIEGDFQNLFNSINENDKEQSKKYRNILEKETLREQQAFNTMKKVFRSARPVIARHRNVNAGKAASPVKRDTQGNDGPATHVPPTCHQQNVRTSNAANSSIEDGYIYQFGNLSHYRYWVNMREWYMEDDEPLVRKFCAEAHVLSGKGPYPEINWLMLRERTLQFKDPRYMTRRVDVLEYSIFVEGMTTPLTENYNLKTDGETWAITEGRRRECLYYLSLENTTDSDRVFSLQEEVCGVNNLPTPAIMFY